jgi:transposase
MAPTRRIRDFEGLEQRRLQAATLLKRGVSQADVARQFGVSRQSVSRWAHALTQHGRRALRRAKRVGRPSQLTATQLQQVIRALKAGPDMQGYATGLWTLGRVGTFIEGQFGIRFGKTRIWQLLRAMGWSCQRPTGQARQRDEAAIRYWKRTQWPRLKKRCRRRTDDRLC